MDVPRLLCFLDNRKIAPSGRSKVIENEETATIGKMSRLMKIIRRRRRLICTIEQLLVATHFDDSLQSSPSASETARVQ
jgi:hypothetical protein